MGLSDASAGGWRPVEVPLSFRAGELTLGKRTFRGLACTTHFTRLQPLDALPVPPDGLPGDPAFVFFPTYPVDFVPPRVAFIGRWIAYTPYTFRNHYIDLRAFASFEDYLGQFSGKSRSTLLRKVRKFAEASGGSVQWRIFASPDEMEEFAALGREVSALTYQERLLQNGLPRDDAFVDTLRRRAAEGGVEGYILYKDGAPAAYLCSFVNGEIMSYNWLGYDPALQALSPGTVLQYQVLESLFARARVAIFDFTEGEGAQKAFFGTQHRTCAKTYMLKRSVGHLGTVMAHRSLNAGVERVGAALDRLGLKQRIRKWMRA